MVQPKTRTRTVDALMRLAAEQAWEEITLRAVAERAGVTLAALRDAYDGRVGILADFVRRIDEQVLAGLDPDMADEAPRERLFDVLFSRFEALGAHKQAIRNLGRAARRDPLLALQLDCIAIRSMAWMMAAAGIRSSGAGELLRAQGLALVWARVMRVWLEDDDPGLARTMAELDRRLREAERAIRRLDRLAGILRRARPARAARRPARPADDVAEGHPS